MTAQKTSERSTATSASSVGRKPWRKKTPVEVVLQQSDLLRAQITTKEQELKDLRRQLQKFDEARKIFETT
jgi:hypothetical protein